MDDGLVYADPLQNTWRKMVSGTKRLLRRERRRKRTLHELCDYRDHEWRADHHWVERLTMVSQRKGGYARPVEAMLL